MVRQHNAAALAALVVLSTAALALPGAWCCGVASFSVAPAAAAAKPADTTAYKVQDVKAHFNNMGSNVLVENTRTTFSCVDARGDDFYLSTPGGDYAELSDAIYVFFEQTGLKPNSTSIGHIFRTFMNKVASPTRPFYFHTDETKLADLFRAVYAAGIKPKPVVFPSRQPSDAKTAAIWYEYLAKPEYQGCGHVRLMLYKPKEYGLTSSYIPEELIKQFFRYWWPTPETSAERKRVDFAIKRGPLAGKAIAIVNNVGPACPTKSILAKAAHGGSSLFVYHQKGVSQFRAKVLTPMFAQLAKSNFFTGKPVKFNQAAFTKRLDALAGAQLGYTVNNLYPADHVNLFAVSFKTTANDGRSNE